MYSAVFRKRLFKTLWRLIPVLAFSLILIHYQYRYWYRAGFFTDDIYLFWIILAAIAYCIAVSKDIRDYKEFKSFRAFVSISIGPLTIGIILLISFLQHRTFNAPTRLEVYQGTGKVSAVIIDFKDNNTYITNDASFGDYYSYGTYTVDNGIYTLSEKGIRSIIASNRIQFVHDTSGFYGQLIDEKGNRLQTYDWRFQVRRNH